MSRFFVFQKCFALILLCSTSIALAGGAPDKIKEDIQKLKTYTPKQKISRAELQRLETATPELVAQGKAVYKKICSQCHGTDGNGDGPKAHIMTDKGDKGPVSFRGKDTDWVQGSTGKSMFVTLTFGLPGKRVSLRNIYGMSPQDRWAVIHYIHSMDPKAKRSGLADSQYESAIQDDLSE